MKKHKVYLIFIFVLSISFFTLHQGLDQDVYIEDIQKNTIQYEKIQRLDENSDQMIIEYIQNPQGNFRKLSQWELLQTISWGKKQIWIGILLGFLGMIGRDLGYIFRIRALTENQLSLSGAFRAIMVWEFSSAISPGVVGGSGVAIFILNREGIPLGRSTAIVFITAFLDNLFYIIAAPLLFIFLSTEQIFPFQFSKTFWGMHFGISNFFWIGYGIIALIALLLFLSLTFFPNLLKHLFAFIFRFPFLQRFQKEAFKIAQDMKVAAYDIQHFSMFLWLKVFLLTILAWLSRFLVVNAVIFAFVEGLDLHSHALILALQLVFWIILLVTPTPGGSGIAELVFTKFLAVFFPTQFIGMIMALVWRLISYYPYLFIGTVILPRWLADHKKE